MSIDPPTEATNHKANLMTGALWAVGTRWLVNAIGLVSTAILARLLLSQDYGIVSMAFLKIGLKRVCRS